MPPTLSKRSLPPEEASLPCASWITDGSQVVLELSGNWKHDGPSIEVKGEPPDRAPVRYQTDKLGSFDSTLPAFILAHLRSIDKGPVENAEPAKPSLDGLPPNLLGLMELALAVPEESDAHSDEDKIGTIGKLGKITLNVGSSLQSVAEFSGQSVLALGRFFRGKARFRARDFWMIVQECGAEALPIVSLISFLIGMILAFVGNAQLKSFGASLFVANLVAIAMAREMGVVMTSIIMSGRTGAAFAAHLGSMKANEEIDALRTFGFDPFDFLVLPRIIALVVMMPLLTLYSDIIGILGGMLVGAGVGIPPALYWHQTLDSLTLTTVSLGIIKSVFFGAIIAVSGCLQGMHAGKSSAAVGEATTRAVVASITAVVILDSAFAVIFTILDI